MKLKPILKDNDRFIYDDLFYDGHHMYRFPEFDKNRSITISSFGLLVSEIKQRIIDINHTLVAKYGDLGFQIYS